MPINNYQIEIRVRFRYGHRLMPPYEGKCTNVHGEAGTLILIFEGNELDENGMLLDFGKVKKVIQDLVVEKLDHAYIYKAGDEVGKFLKKMDLKVVEMNCNPTAENIAEIVYNIVSMYYPQIKKVGCIESFEDSIAWYEKDKNIIEVELNPFIGKGVKELQKI